MSEAMDREAYEHYHRARQLIEAYGGVVIGADELNTLRAERDAARAELQLYKDDRASVLAEECAPDEQHCTCVPGLRAEIKSLQAELQRAREALGLAATAMERIAAPNGCWEYTTEYGPYGSYYGVKWTDDDTPEYILENAIVAARAALNPPEQEGE